jgi:hypothetical protein
MKKYAISFMFIFLIFSSCKKGSESPVASLKIQYPKAENLLFNVLSDSLTQIIGGEKYCVAATLPKGTSLKVIIKPSSGYPSTGIGIFQMENNGWTIISSDTQNTNLQATGSGQTVSISFMTGPPTSVDFSIYENNSFEPTKTKTIKNY